MWCLLEDGGLSFLATAYNKKQVERRAAEDAVPLQRPHLRGQDRGPEALLHQGSLPCSYNHDHYRPHQQHYHDLMFSRKKSWTAWWGASLATPRPTLTRSLKSLETQRRLNMSRKKISSHLKGPPGADPWWPWASFFVICTIFHVSLYQEIICTNQIDNQEIISFWLCW